MTKSNVTKPKPTEGFNKIIFACLNIAHCDNYFDFQYMYF